MSEIDLSEAAFSQPRCCIDCENFGSGARQSINCPANTALGVLRRIQRVNSGDFSLDNSSDAEALVGELDKLQTGAEVCGDFLSAGAITDPLVVTPDITMISFTIQKPVRELPPVEASA